MYTLPQLEITAVYVLVILNITPADADVRRRTRSGGIASVRITTRCH